MIHSFSSFDEYSFIGKGLHSFWQHRLRCAPHVFHVKKGGGEDPQIWPSEMGTETAKPGYNIKQHNIITDVLGGWCHDVDATMTKLFGARGRGILHQMQRAVISGMLNIARTFKIVS